MESRGFSFQDKKRLGIVLKFVTLFVALMVVLFSVVLFAQSLPKEVTEVNIVEDSVAFKDSKLVFSFSICNREEKDLLYEYALYESNPLKNGKPVEGLRSIFSRNVKVESEKEYFLQHSIRMAVKPQKLFLLVNSPETTPQVLPFSVP